MLCYELNCNFVCFSLWFYSLTNNNFSLLKAISLYFSADVESVMNSIVSLLLILETDKQEALIESLCEKLVKFREGERPSLRMQLWVCELISSFKPIHICAFLSFNIQLSEVYSPNACRVSRSLLWAQSRLRLLIFRTLHHNTSFKNRQESNHLPIKTSSICWKKTLVC